MKRFIPKSLFLIFCLAGFAGSEQFFEEGDWLWTTDLDDGLVYAVSINESDQILGQYCSPIDSECFYILGIDISCNSESTLPALVNSSTGALHIELVCGGIVAEDLYRYYITPFDDFDDAIRLSSGQIGIAVGLEGGKFTVSRFSLTGSVSIIDQMRDFASDLVDMYESSGSLKSSETL